MFASSNSRFEHSRGEFSLSLTSVTVWHDFVAVLSAYGARVRPKTVPKVGVYDASARTAPRPARQIALHVMREEEQRLLR
jgi:hypothetical protein